MFNFISYQKPIEFSSKQNKIFFVYKNFVTDRVLKIRTSKSSTKRDCSKNKIRLPTMGKSKKVVSLKSQFKKN